MLPILPRRQYSSECLEQDVQHWIACDNTAYPRSKPRTATTPVNSTVQETQDKDEVLKSFALFRKLPIELQRLIFKAAILPRYVVPFENRPFGCTHMEEEILVTPCIPPLLHACRVSRDITLRSYDVVLPKSISPASGPVYFNPALDTLIGYCMWNSSSDGSTINTGISSALDVRRLPELIIKNVRRLAIGILSFNIIGEDEWLPRALQHQESEKIYSHLKRFEKLEVLYLIVNDCKLGGDSNHSRFVRRGTLPVLVETAPHFDHKLWTELIAKGKESHPDWKVPEIRDARLEWV
ncbi:uncharacterized protein L3040_004663 [Drepanopeziza brunnea f. sp. 'multigermtubi']|uniref:2EXR domain-containing protein n=1 Tax=Marssonina brunnea f. sp. multigermtubi (strain MB_m1) TaxID=1072389 RepID=K1WTS7_MARBU|nr:uncharacterized protein MBM_00158 [Drepanopeziza brunnea f. sp. 'multigermtubi' MB_m1]EKD21045.1 hypothetical protein MBM_00158 [Drepanopeziza brunnea f. sp. 'multigermtubi' MB_m1]KAJ5042105.1 hypothetical protein L3040_004663 [Drepanopeziza brunnea f. sp. 'multigermtubi']